MNISYQKTWIVNQSHRCYIHLCKRKLSTIEPNLSTEEKAAEITKQLFPKWRYYAIAISPLGIGIVWVIWILNNKQMKEATEKRFPKFVELVRKYHGFSDENIQEENRIKKTLEFQQKDYKLNVIVNGNLTTSIIVKGEESASSVYNRIQSTFNHFHSSHSYITDSKIEYDIKDISSIIDVENILPSQKESNDNTTITHLPLRYPIASSLWDIHSNINTNTTIVNYNLSLQSVEDFLESEKINSIAPIPFYRKSFLVHRLNRYDQYFFTGLEYFIKRSCLQLNFLTKRLDFNRKQGTDFNDTNNRVAYINEIIARLEQEIKDNEQEKRLGIRSVDAVDSDIQRIQQEITHLRRKYLNYFYYF